ncbi:MAG: type II toxin-antitoxin system Phd/YefM family antitoxin [Pseudomonadota bacterium]
MLLKNIKPISYVKANAAKIIEEITETGEPVIITQNGEAKAVLVDALSYERERQNWAFMQTLYERTLAAEGEPTFTLEETREALKADRDARRMTEAAE